MHKNKLVTVENDPRSSEVLGEEETVVPKIGSELVLVGSKPNINKDRVTNVPLKSTFDEPNKGDVTQPSEEHQTRENYFLLNDK